MADSYNFNFRVTDRLWRDINKVFDLETMDTDEYKLILCSSMPAINTLLDEYGYIDTTVNGYEVLPVPELVKFHLVCTFTGTGFTVNFPSSEINIELDDSEQNYVQGILLVKYDSSEDDDEGYVLAYARSASPIRVRDVITIPVNGQIMGVGNCTG